MCYCEGLCICSLTSKQHLLSECDFGLFDLHSLKVPVHKILFCFIVCFGISEPPCSHTDANAEVLLNFILLMQRHPFVAELALKILFEKSPVCQQFHLVFPIFYIFCVSCDHLQQNLPLKAFLCMCQLFSCVGSWDSSVSIVTVLWVE